ncbi:hypothetical protein ABZ858_21830 [Streptomyces sp. NPDC047017]
MHDRAAVCIAFGAIGLTAVAAAVFLFLATRRYCMCCLSRVEKDYLAVE